MYSDQQFRVRLNVPMGHDEFPGEFLKEVNTQRVVARYIISKMDPLAFTGVRTSFDSIDEWHSTTVILSLKAKMGVTEAIVKEWLLANWMVIHRTIPSKVPPPAQEPVLDEEYNEDTGEYETSGDRSDFPEPGLGWLNPQRITPGNAENVHIDIDGRIVTVHLSRSIRD